jgi:hypothetical protein
MEKLGVVRPDITPELDTAKTANCTEPQIVDNKTHKITTLDEDFRKQAATKAADFLNK